MDPKQLVALHEIHSLIATNPIHVYNVLEVPTHHYINFGNTCCRYVLCIIGGVRPDNTRVQVCVSQPFNLWGIRQQLD